MIRGESILPDGGAYLTNRRGVWPPSEARGFSTRPARLPHHDGFTMYSQVLTLPIRRL